MLGQDDLLTVLLERKSVHVDEGRLNDRGLFHLQLIEEGPDLRCCRRYDLSFSLI